MEDKVQAQLFKQGPLHERRFELVGHLTDVGLRSGDILYRASNAVGPLGLPFSRLVAHITQSLYSHAAIVFIENDEIHVLEINDQGTLRFRLLDWIDTCYTEHMAIYRLKGLTHIEETKLLAEINRILKDDPDYDFTFAHKDKFYCTESVVEIYRRAFGIELVEGSYIKEIVPGWLYWILRAGSFLLSPFGTSLPFNEKMYFVGNKNLGMIASIHTEEIFSM